MLTLGVTLLHLFFLVCGFECQSATTHKAENRTLLPLILTQLQHQQFCWRFPPKYNNNKLQKDSIQRYQPDSHLRCIITSFTAGSVPTAEQIAKEQAAQIKDLADQLASLKDVVDKETKGMEKACLRECLLFICREELLSAGGRQN